MKVCFKTFGCTFNQADSDALITLLEAAGHSASSYCEADAVVYNTCSVKDNTQDKILYALNHEEKPVVVTGCLSQNHPDLVLEANPRAIILSISGNAGIIHALDSAIKGNAFDSLDNAPAKGVRVNGVVARVRIAEGCAGDCSYCSTKLARGNIHSYSTERVVGEVREAVSKGAVEVELCGQDAGAYGLDSGSSLAELLDEVNQVDGRFLCRVGMLNPRLADASLWNHYHKEFKFLHAPIQSASDSVLRDMNRPYDYSTFKSVIESFREAFPKGLVATDVIVGYPTETKEDFEETLEAMHELRFGIVNVSKYSARPGTRSAELKKLPTEVIKERSKAASALAREIALKENKALIGMEFDAVVVKRGPKGGFIARTTNYRPVVIKEAKLGEFCTVKITGAGQSHLAGELI